MVRRLVLDHPLYKRQNENAAARNTLPYLDLLPFGIDLLMILILETFIATPKDLNLNLLDIAIHTKCHPKATRH